MGSRLENNSKDVRKRIAQHKFDDEDSEEYAASKFGGFRDYMRRKKIKLQNLDSELRSQSTDKPKVFRNVVIHVNGYTQPSLSDLHILVVSHGGGFLQYLDGKTEATHIVASQLTPKKKAEFARYRIVKPAWVVDSVAAGKLLPWENYRVVGEGVGQKILSFGNGQMTSQINTQKHGYKDHSDTTWYTSQVKDVASRINDGTDTAEIIQTSAERQSTAQDKGESALNSIRTTNQISAFNLPKETVDGSVENQHDPLERNDKQDTLLGDDYTNEAAEIDFDAALKTEKRKLTAEEHNAILLQNPHMAKSSTANPDFINQYYRESRLHHLSTWKADLKAQLQARAQEKSSQRSKIKRLSGARRYIMHVDFDSFFASVSLRKHPHLREKAVVIAHGSGPGSEIASCNYPARQFGIKNGMWMKYALEMCPDIKVLPYDYKAYEEASKHFYDSILAVDGVVQSISIDETLIDVSDQCLKAGSTEGNESSNIRIQREQTMASELATSIRVSVREKTGCEVSVGIGNNILLAKVALRKAKPAGQYLIKPEEVHDILGDLNIGDLPGFAHSISKKLEDIGVKSVKDIRALTKERMMSSLGPKTGEKLWDYSRGVDRQEVGEQVVRKSVSAEVNWGIRFINQQQAEEFVLSLCEELSKRLLEQLVKGKQLTMKIMRKAADAGLDPRKNLGHGKCDTFNKSIVLGVATNDKNVLGKEAVSILRSYGFPPGELRGLGVQMQKLEPLKAVKESEAGAVDSSQRRLQFKKPDASTKILDRPAQPSPGDVSEQTHTISPMIGHTTSLKTKRKTPDEVIEDIPTPKKLRQLSEQDDFYVPKSAELTSLNISGTQFVMPSQVDPSVLAELPADIRANLTGGAAKPTKAQRQRGLTPMSEARSRSQSPFISDSEAVLPHQSQLDPEILAALPDDVREELMAEYANEGRSRNVRPVQRLLPQSPRHNKVIPSKKINAAPIKRHKINSLLGKSRSKANSNSMSTLTQSNFVATNPHLQPESNSSIFADIEMSQSFLEELPESVRLELLAEQKRQRMEQKSGLSVSSKRKRLTGTIDGEESKGQQKLNLPRAGPRPTFTSQKLCKLADLRKAMSAWVQTFSAEGEQGPFQEDTDALAVYLKQVVLSEGDMGKAQAVIEWLDYIVRDWPFTRNRIKDLWRDAITLLIAETQQAVRQRGLPPLQFR